MLKFGIEIWYLRISKLGLKYKIIYLIENVNLYYILI